MNANLIVILPKFHKVLLVRNIFQSNNSQYNIGKEILNPEVIK